MLKVFQLRVARSTLGLGVRDIGVYIDLSRSTISKIERMNINSLLKITEKQNSILIKIFNDKGIFFPDKDTVSYGAKKIVSNMQLFTRFQLRGSRAILGVSQRELSELLNIEKKDLNYLENLPNNEYISSTKIKLTSPKLTKFFNSKNIIFPNNNTISIKS